MLTARMRDREAGKVENVKQVVGKAVGSEKLEAEGTVQEAKSEARKAVGDAKEAIKNAANKVADVIRKLKPAKNMAGLSWVSLAQG